MKRLLPLLVLVVACCAGERPRRTLPPPPPAPAPPAPVAPPQPGALNRGVVELEVAGVKVIYKRRPNDDIVVCNLLLKGGSRNLTRESAGIEMLALTVGTEGGTTRLDKDQLAARLESLGSQIDGNADRDYSTITLSTIRQSFSEAWDVFDDVLGNAAFPDDQVALHKERQLTLIRRIPDEPDEYVGQLAAESAFEGHAYLNRQLGFEASVAPLDAARLRRYWRELVTRDRALVVVVGDVDESVLRAKLEATLGALPETGPGGPWADQRPPVLPIDRAAVRFEARELPTTYVLGMYAGPPAMSPDYAPLVMAVRILSNRFFEEVRTKRNLTYAVSARLANSLANYGHIYTTAQDPQRTVGVMFDEVERIQNEPVSDRDLQDQINLYLTGYYMDLQTNAAQAELLGHWELVAGGREYADQMIERLRAVTVPGVQRAARQYLARFRFGVIGPQARFSEPFFRSH
ncbi:MAG: insulinase family protein [Deltaproteobacteria bacterium]|nr:insulinase family protein [Deltaproteobacteria bacterium]